MYNQSIIKLNMNVSRFSLKYMSSHYEYVYMLQTKYAISTEADQTSYFNINKIMKGAYPVIPALLTLYLSQSLPFALVCLILSLAFILHVKFM